MSRPRCRSASALGMNPCGAMSLTFIVRAFNAERFDDYGAGNGAQTRIWTCMAKPPAKQNRPFIVFWPVVRGKISAAFALFTVRASPHPGDDPSLRRG